MDCFRRLQAREVWASHGAWVEAVKPRFAPDVAGRFALAKTIAAMPAGEDAAQRERFAQRVGALLGEGAVLCLPTAPSIAPPLDMSADQAQQFRDRVLSLTCIAGLARLPQVSVPAARVADCPVGLSLVGRHGADRQLLALAVRAADVLQRSSGGQARA